MFSPVKLSASENNRAGLQGPSRGLGWRETSEMIPEINHRIREIGSWEAEKFYKVRHSMNAPHDMGSRRL